MIRRFQPSDIQPIMRLFHDTVHTVNAADYTPEQLAAWAPDVLQDEYATRLARLTHTLTRNIAYVAVADEMIVGFADITTNGYLDHVYTHKDHQHQGIASALVHRLEAEAAALGVSEIHTNASLTARPFFERRGYKIITAQTVEVRGVSMVNFRMVKRLTEIDDILVGFVNGGFRNEGGRACVTKRRWW